MKSVFLVLCILGVVLPYYQLFLFLNSETPTMDFFISEIKVNVHYSLKELRIKIISKYNKGPKIAIYPI